MSNILGYDCDGNEIYEFVILHAIWSNDIDINDLDDVDSRCYTAIIGDDGHAYAVSVYDWRNSDLIRKRENINENEDIPIIIKPISEMENYEVAKHDGEEIYYDLDRKDLKEKINLIIKNNRVKKLINTY